MITPFDRLARALNRASGNAIWWILTRAAKLYANRHLDQWEKVKFPTKYGMVYLALDRSVPYPDSYDQIMPNKPYDPRTPADPQNIG